MEQELRVKSQEQTLQDPDKELTPEDLDQDGRRTRNKKKSWIYFCHHQIALKSHEILPRKSPHLVHWKQTVVFT